MQRQHPPGFARRASATLLPLIRAAGIVPEVSARYLMIGWCILGAFCLLPAFHGRSPSVSTRALAYVLRNGSSPSESVEVSFHTMNQAQRGCFSSSSGG